MIIVKDLKRIISSAKDETIVVISIQQNDGSLNSIDVENIALLKSVDGKQFLSITIKSQD